MKPPETTAGTSLDLDATDEFPVLDLAAYEAEIGPSAVPASHAEQAALITTLLGQLEDLTARLTTSQAECRALEERIAVLTKAESERYSRLKRLESKNAELREMVGQLKTSLALAGSDGLQRRQANHRNEGLRPLADAIEHR